MIPLIYFEPSSKFDNFESTRVRKSLKSSLEKNEEIYVTSFLNKSYDIAHFVSIKEFKRNVKKLKSDSKKVISVLSSEEDLNGKIIKRKFKDEDCLISISKRNVKTLNRLDCVFVPSLDAKEFLIKNGITTRIEPFLIPLRKEKYDLNESTLKDAIYSYLQINHDTKIVVLTIDGDDYKAFEKIDFLLESFTDLLFIVICQKNFGFIDTIRLQNSINLKSKNLILTKPLNEELYCSLLYNALIYINLSSSYGNDQEMLEAMASKTQVLALKSSVFKDIAIDKQNSYLYNDIKSLKEGISLYLKGLLSPTTEQGYEFVKSADVKEQGKKLISIYKDLLGE